MERLQHSPALEKVAGFASINYRLSQYPNHPSLPSTVGDKGRSAEHPDHLKDIMDALSFLERGYGVRDRYILVGHSCGATLAFQTLMPQLLIDGGKNDVGRHSQIWKPQAVVGIAGIYDIVKLRDMDPYSPACQEFLESAFGPNERAWATASPVSADFTRIWCAGRVVLLATSEHDEYVSTIQRDDMAETLKSWARSEGRNLKIMPLDGLHDEVWQKGKGLGDCVEEALHLLELSEESSTHSSIMKIGNVLAC